MSARIDSPRLKDLIRLLAELRGLYAELFAVLGEKLAAMRGADFERMHALTQREAALTQRLSERDGFRRQLLDAIARPLGMTSRAGRSLTIAQVAAHATGRQRAELLAAADELRRSVFEVAQANRVAGAVSRSMLHHLQWVFASVQPRTEEAFVYSNGGAVPVRHDVQILDAVG
ncbi:MAG: flagellar protein FlgN [Planctomycetes bacterium]|nr:flagellar protein FlgN [Planctomycetota bacterium]